MTATAPSAPAAPAPAPASTAQVVWAWLWRTGILVPTVYLALLFWRAPHLDPHDWDYDEGINLMKALLVNRGYAMFTEIWSDQPPLLTVTLGGLFHVTGPSVMAARIVVMVLSALLLWAFYLAVRAGFPTWIALLAVLMLVLSEFYMRLSGAVMVGLPSVALAMIAVALLVTGKPTWARLAISAIVMALALQTKLLTALIVPACGVAVLIAAWPQGLRARLMRAVGWGVLLGAAYLAAGFALGALHFDLLFGTHVSSVTRNLEDFIEGSTLFFPHFTEQHVAYLIVAAAGLVYAWRRRRMDALVPLTWIVVSAVALSFHRPLWYHHTTMLSVPLVWLCAYGVQGWWELMRWGYTHRRRRGRAWAALGGGLAAALAMLALWWFYPNPFPARQEWQMTTFRPNYVPEAAEQLQADATDKSAWIFTDRPFYAFQAGLIVPPPIAVLSRKSLETGIITQDMLARVIRQYKPHFVLNDRFTYDYGPAIMDYVNQNYELKVDRGPTKYYVRRE